MGPSRRRKRRWFAIITLALLLALGGAYAYIRVEWEGSDLGDNIASILNKRMRGRISIGSVSWSPYELKKVVTGGWVAVEIHDVKVWDDCALSADLSAVDERRLGDPSEDCTPDHRPDPDPNSKRKPRKLLIDVPKITAEIDVHAAMFGNHDLVFRKAHVYGGQLLLEQTNEPYPLHAYDRTIVSVLTAFYPRMKAGFRAGIYAAAAPPKVDIRDIHIEDLDVLIQFTPYEAGKGIVGFGLAAYIEDVNIDIPEGENPTSYFHMNARNPLVAMFYVKLALAGKHSFLRIKDEGPRNAFVIPHKNKMNDEWGKGRSALYVFELSDIAVKRLAQMPDQWGHKNYVANTLELDIVAHTIPCGGAPGVPHDPKAGAEVRISGELKNWWDRPYGGEWNLDLAVKNAGPTVRSCVKPTFGGEDLHGTIHLRGPFIAKPRIELDLHGLDFDIALSKKEEPIRLTIAEVDGYIDMVNEQGSIHKTTALIRGGKEPGEVMVSARFGLKPLNSVADIDIIKPIDIGRFLPPRAVTSVGKFLAGRMTVGGDTIEGFELKNFALSLGLTPTDKSIQVYKGRIFAKNSFEYVSIENVEFRAGQSHAVINGGIEFIDGQFEYKNLRIRGDYPDLSRWLEKFGLPPLVQSAGAGEIVLNGPVTNPTIQVRTELKGVPCIDTLQIVNATIQNKIIDAQLSTSGLGGNLKGSLRMDLNGAVPAITKLEFNGTRVEAAKLCGLKGMVKGTLDNVKITIDKRTTIDKTRPAADWLGYATATITAPKLTIMGETYSKVAITLNGKQKALPTWLERRLDPDDQTQCTEAASKGGFCGVIQADRDNGGKLGALVADIPASKSGRVVINRRLGGTVALDDVPLALLDPFIGKGVVGGLVSGTLHLGGDVNAPSVEIGSTINLTRAYASGAYIGDAQLGIIPTTFNNVDAIRIYGTVMAGQLGIDGIIGTSAPYPVDFALSGRRVEVDHFVNLTEKLNFPEVLQAWASGTITVRTELKPAPGSTVQPEAWVELSEVEAIVNHRSREGRMQPLRFEMVPRAKGQFALSARITKDTLDLACRNYAAPGGREPCPAQLTTPAGVITIAGGATQTQMKLHAQGELDLSRLGPLLENQLEDIDGTLSLEAQVTGTLDKPRYEASLDVKDLVSLRLLGGDATLQILGPRVVDGEELPGAQIKIANGNVGVSSFTVNVKDERKDERGELHVTGSVGLAGTKPDKWGLVIEGKIAGKMLAAFAPNALSQASGLATIDAALGGTGPLPRVDATISFDSEEGTRAQPLEIVPRGVRRAISFTGGSVDITTKEIGTHRTYTLDFRTSPGLSASIDNDGKIKNIKGLLTISDDGKIDRATVSLDADSVPYRSTDGTLEFLISANGVRLDLSTATGAWQARGNVAIVNGSYRRNFVLTEVIKPAPEIVAPAKPFWAEYPSIGNADLDLAIEVRKFAVENNIAPEGIEFTGRELRLSGSPREPHMSGTIRVQRGEFKLPATRAKFTRTSGTIDFSENDKATNPSLNIQSDADFFDLSGQAHTITVEITGTLEVPLWDLRTSTGYDKSQTLALLFLGRNPEQLSKTLGDSSIGADQARVDPSTNPGGVGDQLVKDLAGDWVASLFGSSLTKFTGLDVLRFEIGFGSVGIRAEKKLLDNVRGIGEYEQTTRGSTTNARVDLKTPWHVPWPWGIVTNDNFSLQGGYLKKDFTDPAELDIDDTQAKFVYRLFIP